MVSCKINKQCNNEKHNNFILKKQKNDKKNDRSLLNIKLLTNRKTIYI